MLGVSFSEQLPHSEQEINNFMNKKYMNPRYIEKYKKNHNEIYEWAVAFAYFRGGKIN